MTQGIKGEVSHIAKLFIRKGIFPQVLCSQTNVRAQVVYKHTNKQKKKLQTMVIDSSAVLYVEKRRYHCLRKANDLSILHHVQISDLFNHSLLLSPLINKKSEQQK